jgi:hypothetical protein
MSLEVDEETANEAWSRAKPAIEDAITLFVRSGVKPQKKSGQSNQDALILALIEVAKATYVGALGHGYKMGHEAFAGPHLVAIDKFELAALRDAHEIVEREANDASTAEPKNAERTLRKLIELRAGEKMPRTVAEEKEKANRG